MAKNERWASRVGLVLAMAGNAVGLGNFLRFPAQAAQNGGGAFMIPYLVSLVVMGIPLMWIEWTMGRFGGGQGHHSTPGIFQSMGKSRLWKYAGVLGLLTCLGIASYYLYIESWCLSYSIYSLLGGFQPPEGVSPEDAAAFASGAPSAFFNRITGQQENQIFAISMPGLVMFAICIGINIFILSRGVAGGIEVVAKVAMPLLLLFGVVLAVKGLMNDPVAEEAVKYSPWIGLNYVWEPDLTQLGNPAVWLAAAGQIFFTLSIGMGSIHCYASYLRRKDDVALTGATTAWTNELCEVVLGSALLLPIAVSYLGLEAVQEQSGFGLAFMTLPTLFNNWGQFAPLAGFLWFGLLFLAAITSSLAMGQPVMAFLEDEFKLSRVKASWALMGMILLLAVPVATITQAGVFDDFDFWVGTFALVVFALLEVILFAWVFGMDRGWEELMRGAELKVPRAFYYITKYVTPVFIIVILLAAVFKPSVGWDGFFRSIGAGEGIPSWEWAGDSVIGKLLHKDLQAPHGASPEVATYYQWLRMIRTFDRLALAGLFLFFSVLVAIAWSRKNTQPKGTGA
ncbi:sodium-dependent transporter [Tautonia sociabilis]|uniref:Sodium:calcium symporter n=1 Tax=Tautonia sociabilis TaxID=2080755 RepID=A0A432MHB1_9BACT|nr:sodium-dependent transporter [Tautonia sociabilis]RUL86440.1 sodium:calcium symporter [Tautonia sociabilis]